VYPELELTAFFFFAYLNFDIKYLLIYSQYRKTVDISVFSEHFSTNVQNFIFYVHYISRCQLRKRECREISETAVAAAVTFFLI
jgi:hypothetical protein